MSMNESNCGRRCTLAGDFGQVEGAAVAEQKARPETARERRKRLEDELAQVRAKEQEHARLQERLSVGFAAQAPAFEGALLSISQGIYAWNEHQGFWSSENKAEKIALMHSELGEMLEGVRKPGPSEKIGHMGFTQEEEEAADTLIRLLDYSGRFGLRLGQAVIAKLGYNLSREYMHGKAF